MNITITPHNPIKDFFHKIANKIEDCIFTLFERLPDRLIPAFVLNWMERYTDHQEQMDGSRGTKDFRTEPAAGLKSICYISLSDKKPVQPYHL